MFQTIKPALVMFAFFTLLTGLVYPLAVTGIAQAIFPNPANGSLIRGADGEIAGSALIGQAFNDPIYFWGRLSATPGEPYNAASSGATHYSVLNAAIQAQVTARIAALRAADPGNLQPVPVDLVTASASGLDPHISPAAAYYQAGRVARARGLPEPVVRDLVARQIDGPLLGIFGEPRVNVLLLNLALDSVQ